MRRQLKKISIAVICGGRSGEHEVSLQTAASVIAALDPLKYDVVPVRIGKDGRWSADPKLLPKGHAAASVSAGERSLLPSGGFGGLTGSDGKPAERIDFVLPLVHGTGGEDGCLQGLLELAGLPYAGSGVLGSALGMDKIAQKMVLAQAGLPIVSYRHFDRAGWSGRRDAVIAEIETALRYPCFVKPANLGSSVGISKAHHRKELIVGIEDALRYDRRIIVEKAVPEAREIECGVLGNDEPKVSVLGEIRPSNEFYDYEAKYLSGRSETEIPAKLSGRLAEEMRDMAATAFRALDCAGMARVDFLVNRATNDVFLNEVNTVPGFTRFSMFPKLWEASGLAYGTLLDELIGYGLERFRSQAALVRSFAPPAKKAKTIRRPRSK